MKLETVNALTTLPSAGAEFKDKLHTATINDLKLAVARMKNSPHGNKCRLTACEAEMKRRGF